MLFFQAYWVFLQPFVPLYFWFFPTFFNHCAMYFLTAPSKCTLHPATPCTVHWGADQLHYRDGLPCPGGSGSLATPGTSRLWFLVVQYSRGLHCLSPGSEGFCFHPFLRTVNLFLTIWIREDWAWVFLQRQMALLWPFLSSAGGQGCCFLLSHARLLLPMRAVASCCRLCLWRGSRSPLPPPRICLRGAQWRPRRGAWTGYTLLPHSLATVSSSRGLSKIKQFMGPDSPWGTFYSLKFSFLVAMWPQPSDGFRKVVIVILYAVQHFLVRMGATSELYTSQAEAEFPVYY